MRYHGPAIRAAASGGAPERPPALRPPARPDEPRNLAINLANAACFGLALGLTSFVSILPLFLDRLTSSAIVLALLPSLQPLGWHVPQLLVARRVARLERYKPTVMRATVQERLPFVGLAVIATLGGRLPAEMAVTLTLAMVLWFGVGGGITGPPWQSLLVRMTSARTRGTVIGVLVGTVMALQAVGAWLAGALVERLGDAGYPAAFWLAVAAIAASYGFIALLREPGADGRPVAPPASPAAPPAPPAPVRARDVWRRDARVRRFVLARLFSYGVLMPVAFYAVDGAARFGLGGAAVGGLGALFGVVQLVLSPILGWAGDRFGHRRMMGAGAVAGGLGALAAYAAPSPAWIALAVALAGAANIALTLMPLVYLLTLGDDRTRPTYIGLGHTLVTPAILAAPLLGGALADAAGFGAAYLLAAAAAVGTAAVLALPAAPPPEDAAPEPPAAALPAPLPIP